jgi:hypothetical protein
MMLISLVFLALIVVGTPVRAVFQGQAPSRLQRCCFVAKATV